MFTCKWTGESGKSYTFQILPIDVTFDDIGCVYIYAKRVADEKVTVTVSEKNANINVDVHAWQCTYVGQTSKLATRIDQHASGTADSEKCIQRSGATHIHVHKLKTRQARIDVETDIRNGYAWRCNMQGDAVS